MARPLKSQWEFGELFPPEAIRKVLTVSELTGSIRRVLEKQVGSVSVSGEVTNLRIQSSGHIYFSIKDASAQLACVLFRNEARAVNSDFLQDGQKVVLDGEVTVYEARGQYQLRVLSLQLQGVGALQAAFERLKQKLRAEGLFDPGHKRSIPRYPARIGLVTSPDGAAICDVLHAIERRNPSLRVTLAPTRVQGPGAAQEIAAALALLNDWAATGPEPGLDLILLTRGGGSLEDLWAFNEEIVARAIYHSGLPVISAVGHEIDFTISDFVADLRAATPTAAAEIITEGCHAARPYLRDVLDRLGGHLAYALAEKKEKLGLATRGLRRLHPKRRLFEQAQRLDDLRSALLRSVRVHFRNNQHAFSDMRLRFGRLKTANLVVRHRENVAQLVARLGRAAQQQLKSAEEQLHSSRTWLQLLSPENVLKRGYSITRDAATGRVIRKASEVPEGTTIRTRLSEGEVRSEVLPEDRP